MGAAWGKAKGRRPRNALPSIATPHEPRDSPASRAWLVGQGVGKRDGIECAKELWHGGLVRRDRVGNLRAAMIVADCAAPHSAMVSSDRWVASMAVTARLSMATGGNRLPRALHGSGRVAKAAARAGGIGARVGIDCLERSLGNAGCQLSPLPQVSVSCFPLSNTHEPC